MNSGFITLLNRISSLEELSPHELAALLKYLITKEAKVGGPYIIYGNDKDYAINQKIYMLFAEKGKFLKGSYNFISDKYPDITSLDLIKTKNQVQDTETTEAWDSILKSLPEIYKNNSSFTKLFYKIKANDLTGEISNLSKCFYKSLRKINKVIEEDTLSALGKANQYAWLAYSLYDNILDDNTDVEILPIANNLMRYSVTEYLSGGLSFPFINSYFDIVDQANIKEANYRNQFSINSQHGIIHIKKILSAKQLHPLLHERSIIHIIGPLCIAHNQRKEVVDSVYQALSHYCLAKQLNDDIHDWIEDFSSGRPTYVISKLLNASSMKVGSYKIHKVIDLLKDSYWKGGLVELCDEVISAVDISISLLEDSILEKNSMFVKHYIQPLKDSAIAAKNSHKFNVKFLENYK